MGPDDAIISDELNHASIIDGIRLSKAKRYRFKNNDIDDLELKLSERDKFRNIMIATDGVFSMDGHIAKIDKITEDSDRDNFMSPEEAVKYGLIDSVMETRS